MGSVPNFSIHPKPRGWKHSHTLGWELERIGNSNIESTIRWPNRFSKFIGDKAFGLLIGTELGLPIPRITVISRRIAPFHFGEPTGSAERWIRTCPREQIAGKYTTHHGWLDPFALLINEDPNGEHIASVLSQDAVQAEYSGALVVGANGTPIIEGRRGEGEALMKGTVLPETLPKHITDNVMELYKKAFEKLGPVRFEWVHDKQRAWIVQLHRGATQSSADVLVPGEAKKWRHFDINNGLESLRSELDNLQHNEGLVLLGQVGLTSHIADIVRKTGKPVRISRKS